MANGFLKLMDEIEARPDDNVFGFSEDAEFDDDEECVEDSDYEDDDEE